MNLSAISRLRCNALCRKPLSCRASSQQQMSSSALKYPKPIVSNSSGKHTGTVIMLHGLGDSGDGWSDIASQFQADLKHVRFIFPHAPQRSISINMGARMPGWYDIMNFTDINQREDSEGLMESQRYIEELIAAEGAAGIPSSRIVLSGFSQGGAMSLLMLRSRVKLAAVVGLSAYLPLRGDNLVSEENRSTPVLMCHGDGDQVVGYEKGRQSYELLRKLGVDIEFDTYKGMGHSACAAEMTDFLDFIKLHLKE